MIAAKTPTIADIKNNVSLTDVRALLSIAICEVCDFFNIGKNMNDVQIAMTVDLIIERFWYMKLEEIKYCFRRAMMREKLFDRLDGNIIIGWLREYDAERTEEAIRASDQKETQQNNQPTETPDAVGYDDYIKRLRHRAKTDSSAAKLLNEIDKPTTQRLTLLTNETQSQKEHEFKLWKLKYLLKKNETTRQ